MLNNFQKWEKKKLLKRKIVKQRRHPEKKGEEKKGQWKGKRTSRDTKEKEKIEGDGSHWSSFLIFLIYSEDRMLFIQRSFYFMV